MINKPMTSLDQSHFLFTLGNKPNGVVANKVMSTNTVKY